MKWLIGNEEEASAMGLFFVSSLLVMFLHSHYVERLMRRRANDNQRGG